MRKVPFWIDDYPRPDSVVSSPLPASADVIIIGAGFTGLSAGRVLAKSGARVALLEQHSVGFGASSRNGGLVPTGTRVPVPTMIRMYGAELGKRFWQISLDAINLVEELVTSESIDCNFTKSGQLKLAVRPSHMKALTESAAWHERELGYRQQVLSKGDLRTEIGSDAFFGGLLDPGLACLHPAKYVFGLAQSFLRHGGLLSEQTEVTGVERTAGGFRVTTTQGTVTAKEVLFATNGYTGAFVPELRARVFIGASFVIVTEPLSPSLQKELVPRGRGLYDSKRLVNYFRLTPDGRMLYGGQNQFDPAGDLDESARYLQTEMVRVFPQLASVPITHSWSGQMGLTFDLMPHIGRIDGIHYALGYCGRGVAIATYLGTEVGQMLAGQKASSPFADIPHRKMFLYRKDPWFLPLLGACYRAMDRLS